MVCRVSYNRYIVPGFSELVRMDTIEGTSMRSILSQVRRTKKDIASMKIYNSPHDVVKYDIVIIG